MPQSQRRACSRRMPIFQRQHEIAGSQGSGTLVAHGSHGIKPVSEYLLGLHEEGDRQGIGHRVARELIRMHGVGAVEDRDLFQLAFNPQHLPKPLP